MKKIITISREFSSGGHSIGKKIAQSLNIPFYDKEIIDLAAEKSGLSAEYIKNNEQNISSGFLYSLLLGNSYSTHGVNGIQYSAQAPVIPLADQIFDVQRKVIIELAQKGPCVIVGRCADYILRNCAEINRDDLLNIFITAPLDFKVQRAIEFKGLSPDTAEKEIKSIDKRRANHYHTFTDRTWGNRIHYDLIINSKLLGIDQTAAMLVEIIKNT